MTNEFIEEHLSNLLLPNSAELTQLTLSKNPSIIYHNNYQIFFVAIYTSNWDTILILLESFPYHFLESQLFEKEFSNLFKFKPNIYFLIKNYISKKKNFNLLKEKLGQKEIPVNHSNQLVLKI